jgi:hypothetical protein
MGRRVRRAVGGEVYHALNRAAGRYRMLRTAKRLDLESTLRQPGRPKKQENRRKRTPTPFHDPDTVSRSRHRFTIPTPFHDPRHRFTILNLLGFRQIIGLHRQVKLQRREDVAVPGQLLRHMNGQISRPVRDATSPQATAAVPNRRPTAQNRR